MENKTSDDLTLLVVDDEEDLREILVLDLSRLGHQVLSASNGKAALEIIKNRKIDLVISDIRMPGGNGIELLIKSKELNTHSPNVILMTGFSDTSMEEAYDLGADALLLKPFTPSSLHTMVEKILKSKEDLWSTQVEQGLPLSSEGPVKVGRGGMFVPISHSPSLHKVGDIVAFDFRPGPPAHPPFPLKGQGAIRWKRSLIQTELPKGLGVEFLSLEAASRLRAIEYLSSKITKSYIPKV